MTIKSIVALALLAVTFPATAGKVTVHNQGHYLAAFQVSDQDSGVFPIGQSRTIEIVSERLVLLELKILRLFTWSIYDRSSSRYPRLFEVNADSNIEITFTGDIFNSRIIINGNVFEYQN